MPRGRAAKRQEIKERRVEQAVDSGTRQTDLERAAQKIKDQIESGELPNPELEDSNGPTPAEMAEASLKASQALANAAVNNTQDEQSAQAKQEPQQQEQNEHPGSQYLDFTESAYRRFRNKGYTPKTATSLTHSYVLLECASAFENVHIVLAELAKKIDGLARRTTPAD